MVWNKKKRILDIIPRIDKELILGEIKFVMGGNYDTFMDSFNVILGCYPRNCLSTPEGIDKLRSYLKRF